MDAKLIKVFQYQISFQCECALKNASELDAALRAKNAIAAFYAIQSLLVAAANLSKALWDGRNPADRAPLRARLNVLDTSPLHPRDMRNHYEHFDERLDEWYRSSKSHNYVDVSVSSKAAIHGVDEIDMFRTYDPQTGDLSFWGDKFNINQLVEEIRRLYASVTQRINER